MFLFFVLLSGFLFTAAGQEENSLFIVLYLHDSLPGTPLEDDIVYQATSYDVQVGFNYTYLDDQWEQGIAKNVTVTVPWADPYYIAMDPPYVTIEIPSFFEEDSFLLVASKQGYPNVTQEFLVLQGKIVLSVNYQMVEEDKEFIVTALDQNGNHVQGVTVYVDGFEGDKKTTNTMGQVTLRAPEVSQDTDLTVVADKDRYDGDSIEINIVNVASIISIHQMIPIILSVIAVIFAIGFVRYRKNRLAKLSPDKSPRKDNGLQHVLKKDKEDVYILEQKHKMASPDNVRPPSVFERSPRVEEIRIHDNQAKKEIDTLTEEPSTEKTAIPKKKVEKEWFQGTDYMRYKIDEITGEIDGQKDGKWFEGVDVVRSKVDEKLRKRAKKKTEDEEK